MTPADKRAALTGLALLADAAQRVMTAGAGIEKDGARHG